MGVEVHALPVFPTIAGRQDEARDVRCNFKQVLAVAILEQTGITQIPVVSTPTPGKNDYIFTNI